MVPTPKSYVGNGQVSARAYGTKDKFRALGNISVLDLAPKIDTQKQADFQRSGGGTLVRLDRLESVEVEWTWLHFSPENWALALGATLSKVVGGTVNAEPHAAYKDGLVRLAHPPATVTAVTDMSGTTEYEEGVDWYRSPAGIVPMAAGDIPDAVDGQDNIKVTYTHLGYSQLEALRQLSSELEVVVEGMNEAESDSPVLVDLWRVFVPPADKVSLLGGKFGELPFKSELMKDPSKGSGVSAFYRAQIL